MLPVSQGCLVGRINLGSLADACPAPCGLALSRGLLTDFIRAHDSLLSTPRKPKSARREPPSPSQGPSVLTGPLLSLPALSLGSSPGGQGLRPPSSPLPPPTHQALTVAMPLARPTVFPESPDFLPRVSRGPCDPLPGWLSFSASSPWRYVISVFLFCSLPASSPRKPYGVVVAAM